MAEPAIAAAKTIMAFSPLPDETDIRPLLLELKAQGKTIVLPQVLDETDMQLMVFECEETMQKEHFDIFVPQGPVFSDLRRIDVVIVPGVAFDPAGHRLGRGKGYYDRFLANVPARKLAVCLPYQLLPSIPFEPHDILMDKVITISNEKGEALHIPAHPSPKP